ncbi:MAG: acetyltransferase [Herbinix sp.]|jgi:L-amino acid N-acyltransferase YncA|nr:acetyltransferase [Herbinix sp.]
MEVVVRSYVGEDLASMVEIWNRVVEEANAFPQTEKLSLEEAEIYFAAQTYTGVAILNNEVVGLYILHPNNIGRCGHIANASYAVREDSRGKKIGEKLVRSSLAKAKEYGFSLMQFNAVVSINHTAIHLYEKLGFTRLGVIPKGFHLGDGSYSDIILYVIEL